LNSDSEKGETGTDDTLGRDKGVDTVDEAGELVSELL